jgi:hypothetical protein
MFPVRSSEIAAPLFDAEFAKERPQLVGADISPKSANSRFDPTQTSAKYFCCGARP